MPDDELIDRIRNGDAEALDFLVETHYPEVFRYVRRLTNNPDDSDDITQEVFMRLVQKLPRYKSGNFKGYLLAIAHNACMDYFRRQRLITRQLDSIEEMAEIPDRNPGPESCFESHEAEEAASDILAALSTKQREVIILRVFHELELKEIGRVLQIPITKVKSRLYGGLKKLKAEVDAHGNH